MVQSLADLVVDDTAFIGNFVVSTPLSLARLRVYVKMGYLGIRIVLVFFQKLLTAAAAQFKLVLFGGPWTESSNLTKMLSLAVYQFLNLISLIVSG